MSINNSNISLATCDKRGDFNIDIVNLPFPSGDVPRVTSNASLTFAAAAAAESEIMRFLRRPQSFLYTVALTFSATVARRIFNFRRQKSCGYRVSAVGISRRSYGGRRNRTGSCAIWMLLLLQNLIYYMYIYTALAVKL